ncbi:MAG: hypothetical protein IAF38_05985 [Bacteroidia bacterium]|nr:hypothetical protein [Bacteroidia bacterium]
MLKRLLYWFLGFNLTIFIFFEIFYFLTVLCSYPIGFGFTVIGYLLNIFGIFVLATAAGMMLAMLKKKENLNFWKLLLFLILSFFLQQIVFYFQFKGDWGYIAFISLPTLVLTIPAYFVGVRKLV